DPVLQAGGQHTDQRADDEENCGTFVPPRAYPGIRGAMTWSINWDAAANWNFSRTVKPHLATLP
ncbi:hypothetical protein AB0B89_17625, partial [Sphaerisporangium sp. NPDC049002]